jgi:hypothetical protein
MKLSEQALLELLNWELAAYDECAGCHFTKITRSAGGWADAQLAADHAPDLAERFIAGEVVAQTRRVFELAA